MKIAEILAPLMSWLCVVSVIVALAAWCHHAWKSRHEDLPVRMKPSPWPRLWQIAALAVGTRLLLLGLVCLLSSFQGIQISWYNLWARGDAHHYLWIAENGYTADRSLGDGWLYIVFYPLYPLLTGIAGSFLKPYAVAGILVSFLCFGAAAAGMYYWVNERLGEGHARRSLAFLLLFPMGLFFSLPYTESLFMLLSVLFFMALESRRWALAGLCGFLAALTRNMGLLLVVPFALEALQANGLLRFRRPTREDMIKAFRQGAWMLLIPLGMAVYLYINYHVYGDPLMFLQIQKDHWSQQMTWFFKSPATTIQTLFSRQSTTSVWSIWAPQSVVMIILFAALPTLVRKGRIAWGAYLMVYTVVALSPSWLLSFPRYLMGIAPLYPMLSLLCQNKWAERVWGLGMLLGLLYICGVYSTGILVV